MTREFHKPARPGPEAFESMPGGIDPAEKAVIAQRVAHVIVRGPSDADEAALAERILTVADDHGLDLIADLWSSAPADSLPGALWRLYVLRAWVHDHPDQAVREFEAGKSYAPVAEVVAGVPHPPDPSEVGRLVDNVLRGVVGPDLDVALDRAASFAHLVGIGRAELDENASREAARLVDTARALHRAAEAERAGRLA